MACKERVWFIDESPHTSASDYLFMHGIEGVAMQDDSINYTTFNTW